jgi:hypothetical protein
MEAFSELVEEIDSGQLNTELTQQMRGLVQSLNDRAQQTGGVAKGELSVKFKLAATSNGRVEIACEATVKRPGPPKVTETRWIGERGGLVASDPRQEKLPLRAVHAPVGEVRNPNRGE